MAGGCMAGLLRDAMSCPTFWTASIVCLILIPAIAGMIFGKPKGVSKDEMWLFRGAGVEIAFILVPFAFYAVGNILNSSYDQFMASPELPMAAMILFTMTIFSMLKGLAAASKKGAAVEPFMVLTLVAIVLALSCGAYISWLAFHKNVSPWFGVLNSGLIVLAIFFSFSVHAAMMHLIKYPHQLAPREVTADSPTSNAE
jgi:magnesium-transporting ATPase (P-type)